MRRVKCRCKPVGYGVGDGDELDIEGADRTPFPVVHLDEPNAVDEPRLLDAIPREPQRESRAQHIGREVTQEIGEPTCVVLVSVSEHHRVHLVGALAQIGEIGENEIDARHVGIGEHDPAVEDDDPPVQLKAGAVATDLS